jgi:hypothetical protein
MQSNKLQLSSASIHSLIIAKVKTKTTRVAREGRSNHDGGSHYMDDLVELVLKLVGQTQMKNER